MGCAVLGVWEHKALVPNALRFGSEKPLQLGSADTSRAQPLGSLAWMIPDEHTGKV